MKHNRIIVIFILLLVSMLITAGCNGPVPGSTPAPQSTTPVPATTMAPVTTTPVPTSQTTVPPTTSAPVTTTQLPPVTPSLAITSPKEEASVDYRTTVKGTSSGVYGSSLNLYIVIQPHESGEYWVQPEVILLPNGDWSTLAYFGSDATTKDSGKKFTVYAAITTSKLVEGKISQRPDGIKQMIELTRK